MVVTNAASLFAKSWPFVSVPMTMLSLLLSAAAGVHGVAQTVAPRATASFAMFVSLVVPSGAMRIRCNDKPAPVVVDQSRSASAALIAPPHAVEAPKPEIFWCTSERLTTTSDEVEAPPPHVIGAPPAPALLPPAPPPPGPLPPVALLPPAITLLPAPPPAAAPPFPDGCPPAPLIWPPAPLEPPFPPAPAPPELVSPPFEPQSTSAR